MFKKRKTTYHITDFKFKEGDILKVNDIMTSPAKSVRVNSTLGEVADEMKRLNVGSIPVCDDSNNLMGIVTDRDIVVKGISQGHNNGATVESVMTKNPITVSPETSIEEATNVMSHHQIRRLPVTDNGKLVGILALGDIAVSDHVADKAGDALSNISEPARPEM